MSTAHSRLQSKYQPAHRYANFGAVIRRMQVCGFRGISDLTIDFEFPITAISGLNGAGKSTIGQIATCGYRMPTGAVGYKRFYVAQFFPISVADPLPFDQNARVIYTLESNVATAPQDVTVSRAASEWSGYKRQPERYCFYIGFTLYIPKVERRDMSVYGGRKLQLMEKRTVTQKVRDTVARILNQAYEDVHFQGVSHGKRTSELAMLIKNGQQYSENNMGFGEGRVLHLVSLMEEAPAHSLFVLEEPETSLHEEAQHRLVHYLFDVCDRRGHQIIFSTHSSEMLDALPSEARLLLYRDSQGVSAYKGLSSTRTGAILSGGVQRALTVCVEDKFGQRLLREIIRAVDPALLKAIAIVPIGSQDDVRSCRYPPFSRNSFREARLPV
jgi:predicted ATPase